MVLLLVYVVLKLVCPNCTHIYLLLKVVYHHSILNEFKIFIVHLIYRFNIYYKRGMCIIVSL